MQLAEEGTYALWIPEMTVYTPVIAALSCSIAIIWISTALRSKPLSFEICTLRRSTNRQKLEFSATTFGRKGRLVLQRDFAETRAELCRMHHRMSSVLLRLYFGSSSRWQKT
jgi:DNA-binding helix-hairpin-helix protein with protein kinase domain